MKRRTKFIVVWVALGIVLGAKKVVAQKATTSYAVTQQDPRLFIGMDYQVEDDHVLGIFTQDYRITVQNKTQDKLRVYIEYYAETVCGKRRTNQFAPLGDGYTMEPGETVVPTWTHKDFGYQRFTQDECPKNTWRQTGTNKTGDKTYSIITSLGYRIVKIINLSEQERKAAEAKKQKEIAEKKEKEEKEKSDKEARETKIQQSSAKNTAKDDFWGDGLSSNKQSAAPTTKQSNQEVAEHDPSFVASTRFKNNLSGVAEGDYFTDGSGGYYRKEKGGARQVDKELYERTAANKIYAQMERQEAERKQRDIEFKQDWDRLSSSFYSMSSAKAGLNEASSLGGDFETIEQLNAVFAQKMQEIRAMSSQLQVAATQTNQAYTSLLSSSSSGYDYSAYTDAIGGIAAAISAGNAESDARAELQRQRQEEEARIKARQLDALVSIRTEISKVFTAGGMPLSSHKISAPVLYVFAYGSDQTNWNKNQTVSMQISNVIPVYRYSDGSYPYTSHVNRTFEHAGITNPILMGYFTDKTEADNYRRSLVDLAPNAKFDIKEVEVKVKEQKPNTTANTSATDFWGTATSKTQKTQSKEASKKADDFWSR